MRLYGEIIQSFSEGIIDRTGAQSFSEGIIDRTGAQTMLHLICTTITSVDLAHNGVSRAKDWVSVDFDTMAGVRKIIKHRSLMQTEKSKPSGQRKFHFRHCPLILGLGFLCLHHRPMLIVFSK